LLVAVAYLHHLYYLFGKITFLLLLLLNAFYKAQICRKIAFVRIPAVRMSCLVVSTYPLISTGHYLLMLSRNYDTIYPICFLVCHTLFGIRKTILATAPYEVDAELMKSDH